MGPCLIEDAEVQFVVEEKPFLDCVGFLHEIHPNARIFLMKDLHDGWHHAGTPHEREGDIQFPVQTGVHVFKLPLPVLIERQNLSGVFQISASQISRDVGISAAAKKLAAHFPFQLLQTFAQSGLRDIQLFCGFCKILVSGNTQRIIQFLKIHLAFPFFIPFRHNFSEKYELDTFLSPILQ